jgi:hypothetical protein
LSQDCSAIGPYLRNHLGQGRGPTRAGNSLPEGPSRRRPFLADVVGPHQGLVVECGPVSDGIDSSLDRGRESGFTAPPPSKLSRPISGTQLSSQWCPVWD